MKITVINGNQRRGSTWNCKELFLRELSLNTDAETKEFTLPKDLPHFCAGCFSCFFNGEETCPHSESVSPIVGALEEADLVIFTSPVYAMDVSGPMKSLLDHLCFMWMSHRPNPRMFRKVALIITTTAGAGSAHTRRTVKNSLLFWGVNRIFSFNPSVSSMRWEDVKPQKKAKLEKAAERLSARIARAVKNAGQAPQNPAGNTPRNPVGSILFHAMRSMMRKNTWNPCDRSHWERNGWL